VTGEAGPAQLFDTLDAAIVQLALDTYATVGMGRLEQSADEVSRGVTRLRWASAGHPTPLVLDAHGSLVDLPAVTGRLMLGVDRTSTRGETVLELPPGATVLLYTDGLVERPGSDLDTGVHRLRQLTQELAPLPLDELCDQLLRRLVDDRPADDVALLAVRLHRQDRPRPAEAGPNRLPGDDGRPHALDEPPMTRQTTRERP
jgi:hypothetical protein